VTKLSLADGPPLRMLSRTATMADEWSSLCEAATLVFRSTAATSQRGQRNGRCYRHLAIQPVILRGRHQPIRPIDSDMCPLEGTLFLSLAAG